MLSVKVVEVEIEREPLSSLTGMAVDPSVGPFSQERLDEALGFAVGLRSVGSGSLGSQAQLTAGKHLEMRIIVKYSLPFLIGVVRQIKIGKKIIISNKYNGYSCKKSYLVTEEISNKRSLPFHPTNFQSNKAFCI